MKELFIQAAAGGGNSRSQFVGFLYTKCGENLGIPWQWGWDHCGIAEAPMRPGTDLELLRLHHCPSPSLAVTLGCHHCVLQWGLDFGMWDVDFGRDAPHSLPVTPFARLAAARCCGGAEIKLPLVSQDAGFACVCPKILS